ncbi:hypothetical protein K4K49_001745 [Colletotrichum sp. SAR 10_70]|nr:hypothetical protein K4K50_001305 [Colletotrichum sp. SAR 10_71]KAI8179189.1 hypothetical protein K4K49_001745 [Colletotrichum sp. SAR 10_70]
MEPVGLAVGVVSAFKEAYLTIKFIRKTIQSIKGHEKEQSKLLLRYNAQIFRLKGLSRLFCADDGNLVDMNLLETVPDECLITVRDLLMQLKKVLADYAEQAAFLDDDYKRFSPSSPESEFNLANGFIEIEDSHNWNEYIEAVHNSGDDADKQAVAKRRWWQFGFGKVGSKAPAPYKKLNAFRDLQPGLLWVFRKSKLEETLQELKEWNQNLECMIPYLLVGFGVYENRSLQNRLHPDGDENIFQAHIELNNLANDDLNDKLRDQVPSNENIISFKDAEAKASEARVLVEFKQIATPSEMIAGRNIVRPMKELYGPQLARLLRTAGEHSFRTLPFNSYASNDEKTQYMFLFDYPPNTSDLTPKSLNDFIKSSVFDSKYKLELRQRFFVAQTMAQAIGAFHADGWLHKSIRSHAVKFFFLPDSHKCDFANPYLTDFEFSRPLGGVTRLAPQAIDLDYDVYRHPDRHGLPGTSFSKTHDIYSLGVVLIEIGLWETARYIHDGVIECERRGDPSLECLKPQEIKDAFLQDATDRLDHRMGKSYREAVIECLDGDWDEYVGSRDFAKEFYKRVVQKVDIKAFAA